MVINSFQADEAWPYYAPAVELTALSMFMLSGSEQGIHELNFDGARRITSFYQVLFLFPLKFDYNLSKLNLSILNSLYHTPK